MEAEAQDLEPDDAEDRREHRRDAGRRPPPEAHEAQQHRQVNRQPEDEQGGTGREEQLVRRVQQHHAEAAPPIAEGPQLRFALARRQDDRDLVHPEAGQARVDGELEVELHARAHRPDRVVGLAGERPEAAVDVGVAGAEEYVEDPGECRVAEISVERGDLRIAAAEVAAAGDELLAALEGADELGDHREVVGIVRVAHHEIAAARAGEALEIGVPVAAERLVHDPSAHPLGDRDRGIGRAVVAHDDLAVYAGRGEGGPDLLDAGADGLFLVEDWHHDRNQRPVAHSHRGRASVASAPKRIQRMPPATSPAE